MESENELDAFDTQWRGFLVQNWQPGLQNTSSQKSNPQQTYNAIAALDCIKNFLKTWHKNTKSTNTLDTLIEIKNQLELYAALINDILIQQNETDLSSMHTRFAHTYTMALKGLIFCKKMLKNSLEKIEFSKNTDQTKEVCDFVMTCLNANIKSCHTHLQSKTWESWFSLENPVYLACQIFNVKFFPSSQSHQPFEAINHNGRGDGECAGIVINYLLNSNQKTPQRLQMYSNSTIRFLQNQQKEYIKPSLSLSMESKILLKIINSHPEDKVFELGLKFSHSNEGHSMSFKNLKQQNAIELFDPNFGIFFIPKENFQAFFDVLIHTYALAGTYIEKFNVSEKGYTIKSQAQMSLIKADPESVSLEQIKTMQEKHQTRIQQKFETTKSLNFDTACNQKFNALENLETITQIFFTAQKPNAQNQKHIF